MKHRDPRLFHELIGRHVQPNAPMSEPMKGSLSSYLMQRLDQECNALTSKVGECSAQQGVDDKAAAQRDQKAEQDGENGASASGDAKQAEHDDESVSSLSSSLCCMLYFEG